MQSSIVACLIGVGRTTAHVYCNEVANVIIKRLYKKFYAFRALTASEYREEAVTDIILSCYVMVV